MWRPKLLLAGAIVVSLSAPALYGITGVGDSTPGVLDTIPPSPGTATIPPSADVSGTMISYSGASDDSAVASVALWAREDSSGWFYYDALNTTGGSFNFVPGGTGLYHFDLIAVDTVGNRTPEPMASIGTGQGSTTFTSHVSDWMILE